MAASTATAAATATAPAPAPAADTTVLLAECHCKSFSKEIPIPAAAVPLAAELCSCSVCRHVSGNLLTTWLPILSGYGSSSLPQGDPALRLSDEDQKSLTAYAVSEYLTHLFCGQCGANVACTFPLCGDSGEILAKEGGWYLASGMIGDWKGLQPKVRKCEFVGEESTGDGGVGLWLQGRPEQFPKYQERPDGGELSGERWAEIVAKGKARTAEAEAKGGGKQDKLEFYCHCKGVKGYVTRGTSSQLPREKMGYWWLSGDKHDDGKVNDRKKYVAGLCGCHSCRLTCGFEYFSWPYIPDSNIHLNHSDEALDLKQLPALNLGAGATTTLKHYRSSDPVWRSFCGTCGAKVFYVRTTRAGPTFVVDMAAGLFASAAGARAEDWIAWGGGEEPDATDVSFLDALNEGLNGSEDGFKELVGAEGQ